MQPIITRFSGGKFGPDHPLYISKEEYDPQVSRCCFGKYLYGISILLSDLCLNDLSGQKNHHYINLVGSCIHGYRKNDNLDLLNGC